MVGYGRALFKEDLEDPELAKDGPETQALGLPSDMEWDADTSNATLV